jgi:hypothetical protein
VYVASATATSAVTLDSAAILFFIILPFPPMYERLCSLQLSHGGSARRLTGRASWGRRGAEACRPGEPTAARVWAPVPPSGCHPV